MLKNWHYIFKNILSSFHYMAILILFFFTDLRGGSAIFWKKLAKQKYTCHCSHIDMRNNAGLKNHSKLKIPVNFSHAISIMSIKHPQFKSYRNHEYSLSAGLLQILLGVCDYF